MKVVFDTNILFAAFTAHGVCQGLYGECLVVGIPLIVSPVILEELQEKLGTKAKLLTKEIQEVMDVIRADALIIDPPPAISPICRDPDDDWILATALAVKADVIVTGDKDLLVIKSYKGIKILSPGDCLKLIASR